MNHEDVQPGSAQRSTSKPSPQRRKLDLARLAVQHRIVLVLVAFVSMLVALPAARRLQLDRTISAMFDPNDPTLTDYLELQETFGGNAVVMLVYRDNDLDSTAGFRRNQQIAAEVSTIEGVRDRGILSPSVLSDAVDAISPENLLSPGDDTPALIRNGDEVAAGFDALFAGYTHSADHSRAAVVAMLDPKHPPSTILELKRIANSLPDRFGQHVSDVALVGEPVLVHDGFALIQRDGARLATLTVALLSIVVLVSLLDLRLVLLMAGIIVWSITVTRAITVAIGAQASLVSTILTAIVTVISVATVLHLGVRFRIARRRGYDQREACERTIALLAIPVFWTCVTDAAGFAALSFSRIVPVQQFGLMIATAATSVCIATALLAPAALMLPSLSMASRLHAKQQRVARSLRRLCICMAGWFVQRRRAVVVVALSVTIFSIAGVIRSETETSFLKNFKTRSGVVKAYEDVEQAFGGAGVWDVILDAPDQLSGDYLQQVRELEEKLRAIDVEGVRLTKVLSLADADLVATRSPLLKIATPTIRLSGMQLKMPVFFDALLAKQPSDRTFRVMLRSKEHVGANQKANLIARVEQVVAEHTSSESWLKSLGSREQTQTGRVTGYYVMMARLVEKLVGDQWRCFAASGILVWLLLIVATRSLRLATAALVPNLMPVFVILAIVGLVGGRINMGAAMIAAVSIGLSIDGSVHFLAGYQRHRRNGHHPHRSAIHAAGGIGVPVVLATVALVIGFSILAGSEFVPTATFGMLVAATLASGTMINLTLLPSLICSVDRKD